MINWNPLKWRKRKQAKKVLRELGSLLVIKKKVERALENTSHTQTRSKLKKQLEAINKTLNQELNKVKLS